MLPDGGTAVISIERACPYSDTMTDMLKASATTDWRYVPMQEIRELCRVGDTQKPNFLSLAIRKRAIASSGVFVSLSSSR